MSVSRSANNMGNKITNLQFTIATEEMYQKAISEIEDYAIIFLNPEGIITTWNKGAEKIKGYSAEEIIGKHFTIFYTKEDQESGLAAELLKEAKERGRVEHEGWRVGNNEDMFWASVVITAISDNNGIHNGYIKITRDLSERLSAEKVINEYERSLQEQAEQSGLIKELYQHFVNEVEDYAIIMLDKDGHIINWNTAAQKIKGYDAEEVVGKHFSILYTENDVVALLPDALLYKAGVNGVAEHEGWKRKKDGTQFWGNITIKTLYDENHAVKGFVKITKDLTKRMLADKTKQEYAARLEEEINRVKDIDNKLDSTSKRLNRSTQVRTKFEYAASNIMQKPVLDALKTIEELKSNAGVAKTMNEALDKISIAARQTGKQIIDLSLLGVVLEDRIDTTPREFDVLSLTNTLIPRIKIERNSEQTINVEHSGDMQIELPMPLVSYTIENLISNAIKYSAGDAVINIHISNANNLLTIKVEDNGIGIPEKDITQLYEIFFRGSNAIDFDGSGLSLYLIKNYIDSMNGNIICQSIEDKGAVFTVDLPLSPNS